MITAIGQGDNALPAYIHDDPEALGEALAHEILTQIAKARVSGQRYLLGCPGGRSARPIYQALGHRIAHDFQNLAHVVIIMMDNYVVPAADGFVHCPDDAHYSCRRFAEHEIINAIPGLTPRQLWMPDPANPAGYDQRIADAGGIDLFILASGASDGHVAFNPPGSPIDSPTRIVELAHTTRRDNLQTFPDFQSLDDVPHHGVTVGLGTITQQSKSVMLIIHGSHKRPAVQRLHACDGFDPAWPVSCVFACRDVQVHLDTAAAPMELHP